MTRFRHWRHDVRAALYRFLGIVSPTGKHLPMRRLVAAHSPRHVTAAGDRSVAAGGNIGRVNTGDPLPVRDPGTHFTVPPLGALTRFSTGDPEHVHGQTSEGVCGPDSGYQVNCFERAPYVAEKDRDASC